LFLKIRGKQATAKSDGNTFAAEKIPQQKSFPETTMTYFASNHKFPGNISASEIRY